MPSATITSKGQVTIPKKVRDQLQLKAGDTLYFEVDSNNAILMSTNKKSHDEAFGMLYREGQKPKTEVEIQEGITEYLKEKYRKK